MEKAELLRRVRALHRGRQPLNLTAAKRRYPELVEAAYSLKPFLGWKRALEEAGIPYGEIEIELTESVECAICGKEVRNLPVAVAVGVERIEPVFDFVAVGKAVAVDVVGVGLAAAFGSPVLACIRKNGRHAVALHRQSVSHALLNSDPVLPADHLRRGGCRTVNQDSTWEAGLVLACFME